MNKKILGIVLELNPLHYGHVYFIEKAKEKIKPDVTIAILSSSFSMRGEPIILDKFTRAKLALNLGVDIVMELPFQYAVQSSDFFTKHAIDILWEMNITHFAFGAEWNSLTNFEKFYELTSSISFQEKVKIYMNKGLSYSSSSLRAIQELVNDNDLTIQYTLPNNTLGLGYIKAIKEKEKINHRNVTIKIIQRIENNYYDETLHEKITSASSIRRAINQNIDVTNYLPFPNELYFHDDELKNKMYTLLQYFFATEKIELMSTYFGIEEGIENRMANFIKSDDYNDFIENIQTKRYTKNRIQRIIVHLLLKNKKELNSFITIYKRILSMNEIGKKYLSSLPKDIKKNIITSFKNQNDELILLELKATKLYAILTRQNDIVNKEFNVPIKERKENDN